MKCLKAGSILPLLYAVLLEYIVNGTLLSQSIVAVVCDLGYKLTVITLMTDSFLASSSQEINKIRRIKKYFRLTIRVFRRKKCLGVIKSEITRQ
jgi:hypothetical protein